MTRRQTLPLPRKRGGNWARRYAVFGDVHVNDAAARVTGQIIATDTGRAVSALKATGATNNLFPMEDTLGEQARRAVNGIIAEGGLVANPRTAAVPPQQPAPPPTLDVNGPLRTTPDLAQSTTPPYTNGWYDGGYSLQPSFSYGGYGYDPYPYYYYRYPTYIYGGSGIGGGFGRHYGGARGSYSRGGFSGGARQQRRRRPIRRWGSERRKTLNHRASTACTPERSAMLCVQLLMTWRRHPGNRASAPSRSQL